jgi:hypothetical protein
MSPFGLNACVAYVGFDLRNRRHLRLNELPFLG